MERKKTFDIIVSIIIAVVLWVYVINIVNPTITGTVNSVPVVLTGTDALNKNQLAISGSGSYTVSLSVTGTRDVISSLKADDFEAVADVSALSYGQGYITVAVAAPKGVTIKDIKSEKIQVYVDQLVSNTVNVNIGMGAVEGNFEGTVISGNSNTANVSGAKNLVAKVASARCVVDTSKLKVEEIGTYSLSLEPVDADGNVVAGVTCNPSSISVRATVYPTKEVGLSVLYTGTPGLGATIKGTSIPTSIMIKGPAKTIENINLIYSESLNVDGIVSDSEFPIKVILDENVYACSDYEKITANFTLSDNGTFTEEYDFSDILVFGFEEGTNYEVIKNQNDEKITAVVSGPLKSIKTLSKESTAPTIHVKKSEDGLNYVLEGLEIVPSNPLQDVEVSYNPETVSIKLLSKE